MSESHGWETTLKMIVDQMVETGVTELNVRQGDLRLRLRRQLGPVAESFVVGPAARPLKRGDDAPAEAHALLSPLTGVFYTSPNPSAKPYLEVGDWVEDGVVVGLIETMKVFNEVTADCHGRLVALKAEQGQLVQAGEVVALIDTAATPDQDVEVAP